MARKFNAVDQRLAAQSHKLAIVKVQAADAMALEIVAVLRRFVDRASAYTREQSGKSTYSSDEAETMKAFYRATFRLMMEKAAIVYRDGLREFTETGYDWEISLLLRGVPRWYFRRVVATATIGEATIPGGGVVAKVFKIAERLFRKYVAPALEVAAYAEPVADSPRMSDDEWEAYAKEVIFPPLTRSEIETIVGDDHWTTTFPGNQSKFNDPAFHEKLVRGITEGEDVEKLTKSIRDLEDGVYYKARRTARTESLRVAEMAGREAWDDLGEMFVGAQVLAVLDQNTRPHHALRNGTVYANEPQAGEESIDDLPILPDEPNCRCWSVPILAPPEEVASDPGLTATFANAGEENIPDPAAYDQWFNQADEAARRLAVGSRRYGDMAGNLRGVRDPEWTDFIDPKTGKLLSRNALSSETDAERAERKNEVAQVIREREAMIREIAAKGFIGKVGE